MKHLCDTNILAELARPEPNPGVMEWASTVTTIAISVVTVEEIAYGLAWRPNRRVQRFFEAFLPDCCDVLPITDTTAWLAGRLRGELQRNGQTRTQADMLIAATAQQHGLTLVTRNVKDFEGCQVALLNPFSC